MAFTWTEARAEIASYAALPADWDGYGADPIRPGAVADALAFAALCEAEGAWPCEPGPESDGGVGLFWGVAVPGGRDERVSVDLGIGADGGLSFYAKGVSLGEAFGDGLPKDRVPDALRPYLAEHARVAEQAGREAAAWMRADGFPPRIVAAIAMSAPRDVAAWLDGAPVPPRAGGRLGAARALLARGRRAELRDLRRLWDAGRPAGRPLRDLMTGPEWRATDIMRALDGLWPAAALVADARAAAGRRLDAVRRRDLRGIAEAARAQDGGDAFEERAAAFLARHGAGAAEWLFRRLRERDEEAARAFLLLLGERRFGSPGIGERETLLAGLLRDPRPGVRCAASSALGRLGTTEARRALRGHREAEGNPMVRSVLDAHLRH